MVLALNNIRMHATNDALIYENRLLLRIHVTQLRFVGKIRLGIHLAWYGDLGHPGHVSVVHLRRCGVGGINPLNDRNSTVTASVGVKFIVGFISNS